PNTFGTFPSGLNDVGEIVGNSENPFHAFVRSARGSVFTTIEVPHSLSDTTVVGTINNRGQIFGAFDARSGRHMFVRSPDGSTYTTFDSPPGTSGAFPYDINDAGQIAGILQDANGQHGFVMDHPHGQFLIIDHPDACAGNAFDCFTSVFGINNRGQLVG